MAVSDQEILDAVNTAILAIVTGQVASANNASRGFVKLGIDKLQEMKQTYEQRIRAASTTSGMFAVGQFRRTE